MSIVQIEEASPPARTDILLSVEVPNIGEHLRLRYHAAKETKIGDVKQYITEKFGYAGWTRPRLFQKREYNELPQIELEDQAELANLAPTNQSAHIHLELKSSFYPSYLATLLSAIKVATWLLLSLCGRKRTSVSSSRAARIVEQVVFAIVCTVLGAFFLAACAQITFSIPQLSQVPFSMQTFAVLVLGSLVGALAPISVLLYIGMGCAGAPFFAGGTHMCYGSTTGYLIGFFLASIVTATLCTKTGYDRRWLLNIVIMIIASMIILLSGLLWLAFVTPAIGFSAAFMKGVLPFLLGDAIKLLVAALLVPAVWKITFLVRAKLQSLLLARE